MSDSSSLCEDSDSSREDTSEEFSGFDEEFGLRPYQFEPELEDISVSSSGNESSEGSEKSDENVDDQEDNRLANSNWCTCGSCQIMNSINECVCCQEIDKMVETCQSIVSDGDSDCPPQCITQHPGFQPVCTNKYVLRTAWTQYKQQYGNAYEGPEHKHFRHIAYRQLARWCWGVLGKEVRVVLPSCAVMYIRAHFPPPGLEENFEFEGFHYADE
ncbi:uncharacterized protein [Acropora muricata]|uniref:uncharacterized protein n=1 Tax=Acropora muricata TaxID=159855 RepID=UPI0034E57329